MYMHKWELWDKVDELAKRNEELTKTLMLKSAELSEAQEEAKLLRTAIEIHRAQTGHNKCWVRDRWLHDQLKDGKPSPCPDPENIPLEEFLLGCLAYAPDQFEKITPKQQEMLKELKSVIKKYYYTAPV